MAYMRPRGPASGQRGPPQEVQGAHIRSTGPDQVQVACIRRNFSPAPLPSGASPILLRTHQTLFVMTFNNKENKFLDIYH